MAVTLRPPVGVGCGTRTIQHVVKVDLSGVTSVLASFTGKRPPDSDVWILDGDTPAFVAAEQSFFASGPL